ncbi:hypothetical protein LOTGIDRAFT_163768 [Lottia gigantea]|uniref:DNA-directed DNA polymerase n=1 Tax=Lottia gigantea TaxID=225164 RepID=V4BPU5_LOTGI|nr:hypothetical protein LOTGIDRAFT_163768 [Lottia gigantea]ESO90879.1 hypothetical protein LOTGIDRAFT_163768 [Lottia gigantea]
MLDRIKHNFPHLNPTDSVPLFYNKLMNIVEIFVGKDCIDQMLQRLGKIDQKRLTLISHNEVLTSVDIQEIVKAGGRIIKILDGIVYEENFITPPYRDYILILRDLRNKYKREDGFYKKTEIYYTDTDSLYISSSNWDKLNEAGLVSENDYCKGKNDYGDGGIIYGLYLAPKVKYNIILTSDGILKEKKTFKGYSNDKIAVEDYIRLDSGQDVTNEFKKPWEKSFPNGVVIPKDDDKQKKVFRSYLNLVKRKAPDDEGIMYP